MIPPDPRSARRLVASSAMLLAALAGCGKSEPPAASTTASSAGPATSSSAPLASATTAASATPSAAASTEEPADPKLAGAVRIVVAFRGAKNAAPGVTRTKDEARARADEALAKLHAGADLAELVRTYSDDTMTKKTAGATGTFERYAMPPAFADATFALRVGETSGVVETPEGFMIIRRVR